MVNFIVVYTVLCDIRNWENEAFMINNIFLREAKRI